MGTFSSHDKLPEPLAYGTFRLLFLVVSMVVVVIAYNVANNPSNDSILLSSIIRCRGGLRNLRVRRVPLEPG